MNNDKDFGRFCVNGPIVLDSNNSLQASQLPSLNLQVELNPKEARKALRKKLRESCMSHETSGFVENTINYVMQGQEDNQVINKLKATAIPDNILGIDFNNNIY